MPQDEITFVVSQTVCTLTTGHAGAIHQKRLIRAENF
jgi:hypothetical protein